MTSFLCLSDITKAKFCYVSAKMEVNAAIAAKQRLLAGLRKTDQKYYNLLVGSSPDTSLDLDDQMNINNSNASVDGKGKRFVRS